MPVPISVTHKKGVGLAAAQPAELPTEGPFARLKKDDAADGENAAGGGAQQGPAASQQQQQQQDVQGGSVASSAADTAVATNCLSFSYPDIGERARVACCFLHRL